MKAERRSFPRFTIEFPVQVKVNTVDSNDTANAQNFSAQASNLSRTSIEFSCDDQLVRALLAQQSLPYTCELEFVLPWHARVFRLQAQLVTHRRKSQYLYVLVMLFQHENETQELLLDSLLSSQQDTSQH